MKFTFRAMTQRTFLASLCFTLIVSCGKKTDYLKNQPLSENNKIIDGVATEAANHFGLVEYKLKLKKEAFGQNFLLNTSAISGPPSPTGRAFANKIVYFKKRGTTVGLFFENLQGQLSVSRNSLETEVLLAEFPILKTNKNDSVLIDFNKGMKLFYVKDGMRAGEFSERLNKYPKSKSLMFVMLTSKENIFISHKLRELITNQEKSAIPYQAIEKTKIFSLGRPMKQTLSATFKFPKSLRKEQGKRPIILRNLILIKVVWHLTNSIPDEYRQAVIDGVLYWNKAFDKDVIEVAKLPQGVSIHEPGFNVVQWLEWDSAGFAYANLHADPLTGETLQAFVYMTSVFPVGGIAQARRLLRDFNSNKIVTPNRKPSCD